jgi:RNA polymerase sigma-70 factor, ECF subfamily
MRMIHSPLEVTRLLAAWSDGDAAARDTLLPLVYDELRRLASYYMRGQPDNHTLQTTALIHEAYLKLAAQPDKQWQNRMHFFAVAAQAMRHVLVDYARSRDAIKHGGQAQLVALEEAAVVSAERAAEVVALDEALTALASVDLRKSQVVELRYFGGLSVEETAEVLQVSPETVKRDWRLAKLWLMRELNREAGDAG